MADVMPRSVLFLRQRIALAQNPFQIWGLVLLLLCPLVHAKEKPKTEVADLRYGVALYHYYQHDYLSALSELMVADSRDGIQGHSNNPELIAGGFSLAFGMQRHAEAIFNNILSDNSRPQSVRDAAWFYLGKLYYLRGDWAAAEQSFARVSSEFKPVLRAQLEALRINSAIHQATFAQYQPESISTKQLRTWVPYVLYNLGAANARAGDFTKAQVFFAELADMDSPESSARRTEQWALQDKAFTAMGYSYLAQKSYGAAIKQFTHVRLDGLFANQALLGYGWAAVAQEEYTKALNPWQMLRSRSLIYPEVQESLLALPYAYEKLNAKGEALGAYQTAEELLEREITLVRDMRATLTEAELLTIIGSEAVSDQEFKDQAQQNDSPSTLTVAVTDDGQNWLKLDSTSIIKTRSAYLSELFAQNRFQTAVLDLRDLLRLQKLLRAWQPKLEIYQDLLLTKQANRSRQEAYLTQQGLQQQIAALSAQRDQLNAQWQAISREENYIALADDNTRDLYSRITSAQQTVARLEATGEDVSDYQTRIKMFGGILLWNAAQEFPARAAELQAQLDTIEAKLAELKATKERMEVIIATSLDIQPLLVRAQDAAQDVTAKLQQTDALIARQGAALRQQVDEQLAHHEQRLNNYLAQAHLAVARLYDAEFRKQAE
jgi:hypothetical protein